MAKKSRKSSESVAKVADPMPEVEPRLVADEKVVDPSLALLFASSVSFPIMTNLCSFIRPNNTVGRTGQGTTEG
jgi:hypothetical protein